MNFQLRNKRFNDILRYFTRKILICSFNIYFVRSSFLKIKFRLGIPPCRAPIIIICKVYALILIILRKFSLSWKYHRDEYYNPYPSYSENLFSPYSVAENANSHVQDKTCMCNEQNIPTNFNLSHETLNFTRAQTNNILTQNMYIINSDGCHLFSVSGINTYINPSLVRRNS